MERKDRRRRTKQEIQREEAKEHEMRGKEGQKEGGKRG